MGMLSGVALVSGPAADWAGILLDASAKGLAVLAVAGGVSLAMRRAPAAWRHMLWLLVMVSLLALPILSAALPGWQVLPDWVNPSFSPTPDRNAETAAAEPSAEQMTGGPIPEDVPAAAPPGFAPFPGDMPASGGPEIPPADPAPAASEAPKPHAPVDLSAWLLGVWLAGVAACLAPLVLGRLSLYRLGRRAQHVSDGHWLALIAQASAQVGLRRRVRLLLSARRSMPMIWGVRRPTLLLPAEADRWPADRRRVVLLHELAHAARRDCLAKLIAHVGCALYWFNPLAWLAFRQMQREAEAACDDRVLNAGSRPADYAQHILQIASGLEANLLAAHSAIAMARRSKLEGRLLAILDGARNRRKLTRAAVLILLALVVGISIPLACMQPGSEPIVHEDTPATQATGDQAGTFRLSIEQAGLGQALQLLAKQAGTNIVPLKGAQGTVTVTLDGVTFDQALEAVVRAAGYKHAERDGIIYVGTAEQIKALSSGQLDPAKLARQPGRGVDLAIPEGGISIQPYPEGGLSTLTAEIHNLGDARSEGFDVYFNRGDPATNEPATHWGSPIEPGGTFRERSLPFGLKEGVNELFVIVDPHNKLVERDETNNQAPLRVTIRDGGIAVETEISWPTSQPTREIVFEAKDDKLRMQSGANVLEAQKIAIRMEKAAATQPAREIVFEAKDDKLRIQSGANVLEAQKIAIRMAKAAATQPAEKATVLLSMLAEAEQQYAALCAAADKKDWLAGHDPAKELRDIFRVLYRCLEVDISKEALKLRGRLDAKAAQELQKQATLKREIQALFGSTDTDIYLLFAGVGECSDEVKDDIRDKEFDKLPQHFAELQTSWELFSHRFHQNKPSLKIPATRPADKTAGTTRVFNVGSPESGWGTVSSDRADFSREDAARHPEDMEAAFAAGKYEFVGMAKDVWGEEYYKYRFHLSGEPMNTGFPFRIEEMESFAACIERLAEHERQRKEQLDKAVKAGAYRLIDGRPVTIHTCRDAGISGIVEVRSVVGPDGTEYATYSARLGVEADYENELWEEHLAKIESGERELVDLKLTKQYVYEVTLEDGSRRNIWIHWDPLPEASSQPAVKNEAGALEPDGD